MPRSHILTILVLTLALGCGVTDPGRSETDVISEQVFVEVYAELQNARDRAGSAATFESMKRDIFERHGVTEDDILHFVSVRAHDIQAMIDLFDTLRARFEVPDSTTD